MMVVAIRLGWNAIGTVTGCTFTANSANDAAWRSVRVRRRFGIMRLRVH